MTTKKKPTKKQKTVPTLETYSVKLEYTLVETFQVEAESESAAEDAAWMETTWSPAADCTHRETLSVRREL